MDQAIKADICVIGAGSGGLSVAAGAAQMGAKIVLIEKDRMGGDCLNTGCVPSKSLIAAAHAAQAMRTGARFGVNGAEPEIDFAKVHDHVHDVIASIAPHDSQERFEALGVRVVRAAARFTGPATVVAGGTTVAARRFVIATGSRAAVPPIPGLEQVPYLTNESVFDLTERPDRLIVIGAGPVGAELAQAFRRLGAEVGLLDIGPMLPRDDAEAVEVVRRRFLAEGIALHERIGVIRVGRADNEIAVAIETAEGDAARVAGSHLLIAAGRRPNTEDLGLEAAGIAHGPAGIEVDARLRTSNKRVFAIGDVAGGYQFTHLAGYHAGIVIRNALFMLPAKADHRAVPWVTFTDPELAHVGLTEAEARKGSGTVAVTRFPFAEIDRARAERETDGFIKVITGARRVVLGATIVGSRAGELLLPWVMAVGSKARIGSIAGPIAPYPTHSEISKRAAGAYFSPTLFGDRVRRIVGLLQLLP